MTAPRRRTTRGLPAALPMRSNATSIVKSSPVKGVDAGAAAEAIRKKQKDERRDADKEAQRNVAYMNTAAAKAWTERGPVLRRGVMSLFTRQVQLEALEQGDAAIAAQAAEAAKAAAAAKAAEAAKAKLLRKLPPRRRRRKRRPTKNWPRRGRRPRRRRRPPRRRPRRQRLMPPLAAAEKAESAKQAGAKDLAAVDSAVGTWTGRAGKKSISVKEDHTAVRMDDGDETTGAWKIVNGQFHRIGATDSASFPKTVRCRPVHGRWSLVNGEFQVSWDQGRPFSGKLAEDGQRIIGEGKVDWFRKKP